MIQLAPAHRIQVAKQADGIVIPAPPQVARQRPQPLLRGRDEAIERAGFADHRRDLRGGLRQHANLFRVKDARLDGLHHQDALQDAAIDEGNSEKRLIASPRPLRRKYLKRGCWLDLFDRDGPTCSATSPARPSCSARRSVPMHSRRKPERRRQHQVGAVRFQQIGGADVGLEAPGDQRDHVHQRFGGFAAFLGEVADFFQGQNVICRLRRCAHIARTPLIFDELSQRQGFR